MCGTIIFNSWFPGPGVGGYWPVRGVLEALGVDRVYLFSIRPVYANAILSGVKRFELRRGGGGILEPGGIAVIYASGRIKQIIGEFRIGRIHRGSPHHIWRMVTSRKEYGIGRDAWQYISGSRVAVAIEVLDPRPYRHRIGLNEIRAVLPDWNPPMSYQQLKEGDPLLELIIKPLRRKELLL